MIPPTNAASIKLPFPTFKITQKHKNNVSKSSIDDYLVSVEKDDSQFPPPKGAIFLNKTRLMNDQQVNNPMHGITLEQILNSLVTEYAGTSWANGFISGVSTAPPR
jgi:hypothetical protein